MASIYSLDSIVCDGHYVTVPFTKQLVLQSPINTLAQSGAMTKSHDTGNSARNSHSAANPATHLAPTTPTATHHIPRYIPAYIRRKRFAEAVALHLHTPIAYPHDTLAVHDLCVQPTANPESQTRKAVNLILQLPTKDPQNIHSRKIPATQGSHEVQLRKGISQHINRYSRPISAPSIAAKSQSTALSTHIYRGTDPSAPLQIHKGVNSWCPTRHYTSIIKPPSSRSARTTETGQTRPIIPQRPSSSRSAAYGKVYPAQGYHRYKSDLALLKPSSTKESGVKQETQDGISRPPSSQSTAISSRMVASTCAPALLPHEMTTMDTAVDTNHPSGFYNDLSAGVNRLNSGNPECSGDTDYISDVSQRAPRSPTLQIHSVVHTRPPLKDYPSDDAGVDRSCKNCRPKCGIHDHYCRCVISSTAAKNFSSTPDLYDGCDQMVVSPLPLLESPDTTSCILSHPITSSTCFNATISKVETTPFPSNGPILGTNHPAEWNTAALDDRSIIIPSDDPACVSATPHTLTTQKCHVKTRQSQTEHHRRNVNKAIDASVSHRNSFYIHGNRIQQNSSNKNIKSTTRRASSANTTLSGRSCVDSGRGVRYLGDKRKPPDLPLVNRAPTDECFDMPELVIHWEAIQCGNPISDVHLSASATDVVN